MLKHSSTVFSPSLTPQPSPTKKTTLLEIGKDHVWLKMPVLVDANTSGDVLTITAVNCPQVSINIPIVVIQSE